MQGPVQQAVSYLNCVTAGLSGEVGEHQFVKLLLIGWTDDVETVEVSRIAHGVII